MPKVTIIQVVYNSKRFIEPVFGAIFKQTFKDFNVAAVIAGNDDGGKELLMEKFPSVEILDPGYNIGFAAGHNWIFDKYSSDLYQLVNPDLIIEPDYIANILKAFDDPKVGAATGKLLRYYFDVGNGLKPFPTGKTDVIDSTGVIISKSGRARDRGQHEIDIGQYDNASNVAAVSGAGAMYRKKALENIRIPKFQEPSTKNQINSKFQIPNSKTLSPIPLALSADHEYFDVDFHSYWEDVDLSWRMSNAGWKNVFVPSAVAYHGRAAGSSEKGYSDVAGFISHHRKLSPRVRRLNYKNHIFMYIKNSPWLYPQFFIREFFMLIYILIFEISTLKVLPEMFKLLPKMWKKRKLIKQEMN